MTPKEQYEARKAERQARRSNPNGYGTKQEVEDFLAFMDLADRFVTAAERIADALEEANRPINVDVTNGPVVVT